jgi:AraC-like DNA-binding protein
MSIMVPMVYISSTLSNRTSGAYPAAGAGNRMFGKFTTVEVADPHQTSRLIWESLTPEEKAATNERNICAREFEALDWRRFQREPEGFRSHIWFASAGEMRATRVENTAGTRYVVRSPGTETYCISLMERGTSQLTRSGSNEPLVGTAEFGLVVNGCEPGTRFAASDGSSRLNLWVSRNKLRERLELLLDGLDVRSFAFEPIFDHTKGSGATIRHMLDFLLTELARSDSLLRNVAAIRSFEENLELYLLLGLPHSHTRRLQQQRAGAAPGNVRRAEEFMRANTGAPMTIAEIAQAAACSVRALQAAFQRFRGTTPMAALRRIRLEAARTELLRASRTESIARIAAGHGFSTPSRFAQLYRRTYGIYPSEALRTQRSRDRS